MNLREWWSIYSSISEDFSFEPQKDYLSSLMLSCIIGTRNFQDRLKVVEGRKVSVVGNAENVSSLIPSISDGVVIVADSALDCFYDIRGSPDIVVSDLDGNLDLISQCSREGSTLIVHSHGDNIHQIESLDWTSDIGIIGTTQNIPLWNVFNFGGFTDGDRSAFIADAFGADTITLVGFDFDRPNMNKPSDPVIKRRKLKWASYLLEILAGKRSKAFAPGDFIEI